MELDVSSNYKAYKIMNVADITVTSKAESKRRK